MTLRYIAAIDQGTTSTRCMLFDRNGPVSMAQKENSQIMPKPGWVEHDAEEIWASTQEVIQKALHRAEKHPYEIAAVGITNQRETIVVWDRETGRPYCNALVWQDTRTKDICDTLASVGGQDRFRSLTGLPLATYFSAPKLKWIFDNNPFIREAAEKGRALFGTIDSWLIWKLTGRHLTDPTNASRTMLMNLQTLDWDDSLLGAFGVPRSMLPKIVASSSATAYGMTKADGPFPADIPVAGNLGDQQAALVGQTCFQIGESKNTYGTGCFLLLNTGEKIVQSNHGLLTTVAYQFEKSKPVYALEGSVAVTGSLVQWLRDQLGIIQASADIEPLASTVSDNGGVYIVPAFSGLFAPYWRSDARGVIAGLTSYSTKAHLARAVLEATAYQTRDVTDAMAKDAGTAITTLKVDGGMSVNSLLMQFQADVLNVPVVRSAVQETTAQGAAYAAGLAVGFWDDLDDLRRAWRSDRQWTPSMSDDKRACLLHDWRRTIDRSMNWIED